MTLPPDDHGSDDLRNKIGDVDPLKWLESLAARQGANPEEFVTSADLDVPEVASDTFVDEPGYQDYDPYGSSDRPATPKNARPAPEPAPEPPAPEPETVNPAELNPLAWLESLARRQGANPDEFVTTADLEVEEVDPDTVIDEPGYTPYDGKAPTAAAPPPPSPAPAPVVEELPQEDEVALSPAEAAALLGLDTLDMIPPQPVVEPEPEMIEPPVAAQAVPPVAAEEAEDVDPLAWLESLARRQGARSEELITGGTLDVPEAAADAVVDEPGYVDYSPFGTLAERADEDEPEAYVAPVPEPEMAAEVPSGDDTLAWLEGLAAEQGASAIIEPAASGDSLAGMSDEEIEQRAAAGELTPAQMEAWLARQAESLAQVHFDDDDMLLDELAPAVPAEMPDWLQEAAPVPSSGLPEPEVEEFVPEEALDLEPAELPGWLQEPAPEPAATLAELEPTQEDKAPIDYEDSWARALDSEFMTTQRLAPDEEPEWYQSALRDPEREAELQAELAEQELDFEVEEEALPEPVAAELPDWLREAAPQEPEDDIPDWLTEEIPGSELSAESVGVDDWLEDADLEPAELPDWLDEPVAEAADLPGWLAEAAPDELLAEPVAEVPEPVAAPAPSPRPQPALTAEVPAGAAYDSFRAALQQNPQDHAARLKLARQLHTERKLPACLAQYEALVLAEADLGTLETDLMQVVEQQPAVPQARRVLGDVLMRQGRLQEALETYRAALEQL